MRAHLKCILTSLAAFIALVTPAWGEPPEGSVEIPADHLLVIQTSKGNILVAMTPDFAPAHVTRMQELARARFYDGLIFHRVIDDFMAQGGSPELSGQRRPEYTNLMAEFTNRLAIGFTPISVGEIRNGRLTIGEREFTSINGDSRSIRDAFPVSGGDLSIIDGYVVFHEPAGRAALSADGKVMANIQHCPGVASMARTDDPNSASTQFFLMRGPAPWLDRQYSAWGRVIAGQEIVMNLAVSETDEHAEAIDYPDRIYSVRLASDIGEERRPRAYWPPVDRDAIANAALAAATTTQGFDFNVCPLAPTAHVENFSPRRESLNDLIARN